MNKEKVIDKIKKLLALSQSDNPGEAENALLMARKLMAEHKLSERDVADVKKPGKLNHLVYEGDTFSSVKNGWMIDLSHVIAENHCCCTATRNRRGSKVNRVQFTGLDDDPAIAMTMFDYAVQHIKHMVALYRKNGYKGEGWPVWVDRTMKNRRVRVYEDNYAIGFTAGLEAHYKEQFKGDGEEVIETALVLVQPKEVKDYEDNLRQRTINLRKEGIDPQARQDGYHAGYNFNPTKQITEEAI